MTKNAKYRGSFLKTYAVAVLCVVISAASVQAEDKAICEVVNGKYDNSMLTVHGDVVMESEGPGSFALSQLEKLTINVTGKDETFTPKVLSIGDGTKWDLTHDSYPDNITAVLLVNQSPGKNRRFKALLVISGVNINLTIDGGYPFFSERSLVYNLKCKAE